jgi:hypothetical protein
MKSSLEGALATLGANGSASFDSPFDHTPGNLSSRPSRPRVDPFKKFDNLPNLRGSDFRFSFDEQFPQQ